MQDFVTLNFLMNLITSVKLNTQASPSMAEFLPCNAIHSLDSMSKPSVFTSATILGCGHGMAGIGQCDAERGHRPAHLKAGVICTTIRSRIHCAAIISDGTNMTTLMTIINVIT
uniref:Uncharacterized protein n=1 Tax=Glossina austeni TaxID=7395 RepID=A0A1A9UVM8_GLOAU